MGTKLLCLNCSVNKQQVSFLHSLCPSYITKVLLLSSLSLSLTMWAHMPNILLFSHSTVIDTHAHTHTQAGLSSQKCLVNKTELPCVCWHQQFGLQLYFTVCVLREGVRLLSNKQMTGLSRVRTFVCKRVRCCS